MTIRDLVARARPYWRVPLVALLGGLLAYVGSFAFSPVYQAKTQVLIRGRDTSILSSSGSDLKTQPAPDAALVLALGQTQSGLVSSSEVAERIVDELKLADRPDGSSGLVGSIKDGISGTITRTRAYVTHGFYKKPTAREAAIAWVKEGLSATPLENSYVLEITGSADESALAAQVTNRAADILIEISNERSRSEAATNRDFLATQVTRSEDEVIGAISAIRQFESQNGIVDLGVEVQVSSASREELRNQLQQTKVDLLGAQAELDTARRNLRSTSQTGSNTSEIITGRSTTEIQTSGQNPVYESIRIEVARLESRVASLGASRDALQAALDGRSSGVEGLRNEEKAQLQQLQLKLQASEAAYTDLRARHEEAVVAADRGTIEMTRIDTARAPGFPVRPLRYIYLALGLLCGALAGAGLTWIRSPRSLEEQAVVSGGGQVGYQNGHGASPDDSDIGDLFVPANGTASSRRPKVDRRSSVTNGSTRQETEGPVIVLDDNGGATRRTPIGDFEVFRGGETTDI